MQMDMCTHGKRIMLVLKLWHSQTNTRTESDGFIDSDNDRLGNKPHKVMNTDMKRDRKEHKENREKETPAILNV